MSRKNGKLPEFVKQKRELARLLGVSPTVVHQLTKDPHCPPEIKGKGWSLREMAQFAKTRMKKQIGTDFALSDVAQLRLKELSVKITKLELQIDKERGTFIDRETWKSQISAYLVEFDQALTRAFLQELPTQLQGLSPIEIKLKIEAEYTRIKNEFYEKASTI